METNEAEKSKQSERGNAGTQERRSMGPRKRERGKSGLARQRCDNAMRKSVDTRTHEQKNEKDALVLSMPLQYLGT